MQDYATRTVTISLVKASELICKYDTLFDQTMDDCNRHASLAKDAYDAGEIRTGALEQMIANELETEADIYNQMSHDLRNLIAGED